MVNPLADPVGWSLRLKEEADLIIQELNLYEVLSPYGRIVPTGSYFLDLMMYPDIDLYLSSVSIGQLFEIGGQLARSKMVFQVVFEKSRTPQLPGGLYLKARIDYGDWGRPWKIDIWSLDDSGSRSSSTSTRCSRQETGRRCTAGISFTGHLSTKACPTLET
jgi:hypothetical protein